VTIEFVWLTLNSFEPEDSLVVSKWDVRGVNLTMARKVFGALLGINGFETYMVPSLVLNPPLAVRAESGTPKVSLDIRFGESEVRGPWWFGRWCLLDRHSIDQHGTGRPRPTPLIDSARAVYG